MEVNLTHEPVPEDERRRRFSQAAKILLKPPDKNEEGSRAATPEPDDEPNVERKETSHEG